MADDAYIKYLKGAAPKDTKGDVSFTETRCHFRANDFGSDKIVEYGEDFVIVTHGNLQRSFHISLFSLVLPRV